MISLSNWLLSEPADELVGQTSWIMPSLGVIFVIYPEFATHLTYAELILSNKGQRKHPSHYPNGKSLTLSSFPLSAAQTRNRLLHGI